MCSIRVKQTDHHFSGDNQDNQGTNDGEKNGCKNSHSRLKVR